MSFTGNIYGMQDNELRLEKEVFFMDFSRCPVSVSGLL